MDHSLNGEQKMSFRRAIIIGSSGQVSKALASALEGREVLFTSSKGGAGTIPLDLADPASIRKAFTEIGAKYGPGDAEVFLSGALTHVDKCEQEQDLCRKMNWEGPALVAAESRALGYGLTYFSTEYVFGGAEYEGGEKGPFGEGDTPHPTSWYGRCKLEAERAIEAVYGPKGALIVRTTMVFSWDPTGMNFLMQYLRQLETTAAGKTNLFRVPVDQISTPTYAPALAEATIHLRDKGLGGIFNIAGTDLLSRRELVERVAERFGFDRELVAKAFQFVLTSELGQAAKRPLTAGLSVQKAQDQGLRVDSLKSSLTDVMALRGH